MAVEVIAKRVVPFDIDNAVVTPTGSDTSDSLADITSDTLTSIKGLQGSYSTAPIYPDVYANTPTISFSDAATVSGQEVSFNGEQLKLKITSQSLTGSNVLNMASGDVDKIQIGATVQGIKFTSNGPTYGETVSYFPENTKVISKTATTITLSKSLLQDTGGTDSFEFGPIVVTYFGINKYIGNFFDGFWMSNDVSDDNRGLDSMVEFDYYGDKLEYRFRNESADAQYWIWIDGQPLTETYQTPTGITPASGSTHFGQITFNNASDNVKRWRRVRIYLDLSSFYLSFNVSATDTISATKTTYPKVAWLGDSYIGGTTAVGEQSKQIVDRTSYLLGSPFAFNSGFGGTGYVSSVHPYTEESRIAGLETYDPDILVVFGSVNDNGETSEDVSAAATSLFASLKARLPRTKIFVVGPQSYGASTLTDSIDNDAAIEAAAIVAGFPYKSPIKEQWILGTGKDGSPTGFGNSDLFISSDGVHPTDSGAEYYSRRMAEWMLSTYNQ